VLAMSRMNRLGKTLGSDDVRSIAQMG
jgi:hypothetical protein